LGYYQFFFFLGSGVSMTCVYYPDCFLKIFFIYKYIKIILFRFFLIFNIDILKSLENTKNINIIFFKTKYIFETYSNIILNTKINYNWNVL
jgi:hypothetical protein